MEVIRIVERTRQEMVDLVEKYRKNVEKYNEDLKRKGCLSHFDTWCMEKDKKNLEFFDSLLAENREVYHLCNGKMVDFKMTVIEK